MSSSTFPSAQKCHNKHVLKLKRDGREMGKIVIDKDLCKGCTLCVNACPQHLIRIGKRLNPKGYYHAEFVDSEGKCGGCTLCALTCPDFAIEVYREKKTGGQK